MTLDAPIYTGTKIYWEEYRNLKLAEVRFVRYRFSPYVTVSITEKAGKVTLIRDQDQYGVAPNGEVMYLYTRRETETAQKFLCVGGPFNKTHKTVRQAGDDYEQYNCATRYGKADKIHPPKVILIFKDLLCLPN
jgi:hypothetical protein